MSQRTTWGRFASIQRVEKRFPLSACRLALKSIPTMKPRRVSVFAICFSALIFAGCAHKPLRPASDDNVSWKVVRFPHQTLTFKPTRDDITVGCVIFSMYQSDMGKALNLDAVRVNGSRPKSDRLYLREVGKNRFELPALTIEFYSKEIGGPLYLALKAWFNELTNQEDSPYYESDSLPDRYALLSYCTDEDDDPSKVNARLGANRAKTLKEFKARLAKPFVIRLNQRPLGAGLGHWPMINNQGRELDEADLKSIEQLVRERGERYVIAISANSQNRALAAVGDHDLFESTRRYELGRVDGAWRIMKVETRAGGW
jgi:hypothetical protein